MNYLISSISVLTFLPNAMASPYVNSIIPVSIDIVVVFPAPLWPSSTKI